MFQEKLAALRRRAGFSQEKLAEILDVTRQAVQKWEYGAAMPDIPKLIAIGELFNVTLDWLLSNRQTDSDAIRQESSGLPQYSSVSDWEAYYSQLPLELVQSTEEGRDVLRYEALAAEIDRLAPDIHKKQMADAFYGLMGAVVIDQLRRLSVFSQVSTEHRSERPGAIYCNSHWINIPFRDSRNPILCFMSFFVGSSPLAALPAAKRKTMLSL